jgi:Fe-Mn family superoxide dismutase
MNMKKATLIITLISIVFNYTTNAQFSQTKLPYGYNALEPAIDAKTMDVHFNKHHAGYVKKLNAAIKGLDLEDKSLEEILSNVSKYDIAVRNNGGGHYNHELFWSILTPEKDTKPSKELEKAIKNTFGSIDSLIKMINKSASTRFGSGWAWLYVDNAGKLAVCSTPNQDNPLMDITECRGIPILGIDVWEHAYYLKYQNQRGSYLGNIWSVINWEQVSKYYEKAMKR